LQSKRGDLASAEKAFERALAIEPENATTLRHLFSVYFRQERSDRIALIRARIQSLNLEKLKGSAQDKIALAHVMRDVGEGQRALAWAYEIVQSNRNDPQVALGYFGLIMARGDAINIPTPSGVGIDTWVSIQNNLGEKQAIVIEDGVDKPADGIYTPGHSFIAPALGLKVGQSFTQARHIGRPETWTILAVKHKYLHALHDIMETFNVRFPEEQGFYRVTTQDGDISPILDEVKTHSERSQAIVDLYIEKKIPLAFMAAMTRNEVIKFASGISQSGQDIATCYGNNAERAAAEDLVRTYANKGAVFDCYTVWTAEALGILPALRKLFGTLLVPRSAIDELAIIQHEMEQNPGPVMTVIYRDGQYFREQLTAEENDARIKAFGERRRNIERHCEIVPVDVPDSASDLARGLIEQTDSHILDSAFLAADKNGLLLSDDLYYRQIVQQACGTKGTFLQASITIAAARGLLDGPALAAAIVGIAALRHAHVALSPAILFEIVKQDKTDRQLKFRAVTEFIGTKAYEINSHVHVTIIFMIQVWNFDFPDVVKQACSGIIIQQLLRYRQTDYRQIIEIMRSLLARNVHASDYLEAWIRGHFLNI
jgi:cellulose synthase operon protein C